MPFMHLASGMPLDVVLAASGLEDEVLARSVMVDIGGTRIPVLDAEDLVIAKEGRALAPSAPPLRRPLPCTRSAPASCSRSWATVACSCSAACSCLRCMRAP